MAPADSELQAPTVPAPPTRRIGSEARARSLRMNLNACRTTSSSTVRLSPRHVFIAPGVRCPRTV